MAEKKRVYESDVMGLPALRLVLGEVPSPDPDGRNKNGQQPKKSNRELEGTVKKLIAHLKEEQR